MDANLPCQELGHLRVVTAGRERHLAEQRVVITSISLGTLPCQVSTILASGLLLPPVTQVISVLRLAKPEAPLAAMLMSSQHS